VVASAALAVAVAGCAGGGSQRTPQLSSLPLVPGSRIVVRVHKCDTGANSFCAWELVVVAPRYPNSDKLVNSEQRQLHSNGWSNADGDIGGERAADSPGHSLRLTYATPTGDLQGIDLGWIRRSRPVTLALSRAIFEHAPAMSMLLELGTS
jgi:hypothetical protein